MMIYSCLFVLMSTLCAIDAAEIMSAKCNKEDMTKLQALGGPVGLAKVADTKRNYCAATKPEFVQIGSPDCANIEITKETGGKATGTMTLTKGGKTYGSPIIYDFVANGNLVTSTMKSNGQVTTIAMTKCPKSEMIVSMICSEKGTATTPTLTLSTVGECDQAAYQACETEIKKIFPQAVLQPLTCKK